MSGSLLFTADLGVGLSLCNWIHKLYSHRLYTSGKTDSTADGGMIWGGQGVKTLVSFMWSRLLVNVGSIGCCSPDATGPEGVNAEGMYPVYIVGTLFLTSLSCQLTFWYLGVCLVVVFAACG